MEISGLSHVHLSKVYSLRTMPNPTTCNGGNFARNPDSIWEPAAAQEGAGVLPGVPVKRGDDGGRGFLDKFFMQNFEVATVEMPTPMECMVAGHALGEDVSRRPGMWRCLCGAWKISVSVPAAHDQG